MLLLELPEQGPGVQTLQPGAGPFSEIQKRFRGSRIHRPIMRALPAEVDDVGTARAMARAYSVFATGGRELGMRQETLKALKAPAIPSAHGFYD